MVIGLVSDSHGDAGNLQRAAELLASHRAAVVAHLGDEWEDARLLQTGAGTEVIAVPGLYAKQYYDPAIPNRESQVYGGWRFLFSHTRERNNCDTADDLDPAALATRGEVDVVAFGHTHIPLVEVRDGVLWVNPGHLSAYDRHGFAPSYAVLEVHPERIVATLHDLETGTIIVRHEHLKPTNKPA